MIKWNSYYENVILAAKNILHVHHWIVIDFCYIIEDFQTNMSKLKKKLSRKRLYIYIYIHTHTHTHTHMHDNCIGYNNKKIKLTCFTVKSRLKIQKE